MDMLAQAASVASQQPGPVVVSRKADGSVVTCCNEWGTIPELERTYFAKAGHQYCPSRDVQRAREVPLSGIMNGRSWPLSYSASSTWESLYQTLRNLIPQFVHGAHILGICHAIAQESARLGYMIQQDALVQVLGVITPSPCLTNSYLIRHNQRLLNGFCVLEKEFHLISGKPFFLQGFLAKETSFGTARLFRVGAILPYGFYMTQIFAFRI